MTDNFEQGTPYPDGSFSIVTFGLPVVGRAGDNWIRDHILKSNMAEASGQDPGGSLIGRAATLLIRLGRGYPQILGARSAGGKGVTILNKDRFFKNMEGGRAVGPGASLIIRQFINSQTETKTYDQTQ